MSHEASSSGDFYRPSPSLPPANRYCVVRDKKREGGGGGIAKAQFENLRLKYPVRRSTFYNEISYPLFFFFFIIK